jgi:hypothetical protein
MKDIEETITRTKVMRRMGRCDAMGVVEEQFPGPHAEGPAS